MSGKWWTTHEIRRLQANYPFRPARELLDMFPGRTLNGIYWMANKQMKLGRRRKRKSPKPRTPRKCPKRTNLLSDAKWLAICAQHKPVIFGAVERP